jgi:hypothetical protein
VLAWVIQVFEFKSWEYLHQYECSFITEELNGEIGNHSKTFVKT